VQNEELDMIDGDPDRRLVHWYWESVGNVGKTFFTKYLKLKKDAIVLHPGKGPDLAHICRQNIARLVVFDLTRSSTVDAATSFRMLRKLFEFIEILASGMMTCTKFDSGTIVFHAPIVLVFANVEPDRRLLSADRWRVTAL
jgi:hypothetical protein